MKKNKKIPKYNFGGKLEKGLKDYALGMADSTLAVVGLDNVVKDDQYSDTGFGNFAKKTSNITGAIGKTALPIAANIVAPGSGKFVSMGQQAIGQFNPQDPSQFDAQGNPIDPNMQTAKQAIGNLGAVGVAATDLMNDNKKNLPTTTITRTGSAPNPSNLHTNQYSPEWNSLNNNSAEGTGVLPNQDPNIQTSRYGGIKYPNGGMNMAPNAELEKQENVVAPNGEFLQVNGSSHEEGGVPVALPGNSMIFSDRLKLGKKTFAELNKVNNTSKEDKILESNKYGNTSKRTAELMKFAKNKNSEALFNAQEALKQAKVEAYAKKMGVALPQAQKAPEKGMQYPNGGIQKYGDGGPTTPTLDNNSLIAPSVGQDPRFYNYQGNQVMVPGLRALSKDKGVSPEIGLNNYNSLLNTRTQVRDSNINVNKQLPKFEYLNDPTKGSYDEQFNAYKKVYLPGFKYGGKMLPKFDLGGKMVNGTWVPDNYNIITAHNATNSYKPGTIGYYDSMNSPDKPSNDSLQSSYGPDVLPWNRSNDSGNSAAYDNTVNPQQFQEVTSNSKSNIGSPKVTDPNDKNFDWGKLKTVGQNYGNFALQNAGNIYDLTRKKDPLQKYDRATAKFLDPSSAIRDALAQTRRAEYNVRGASGGNAGTYLSNRVALNAQNTENLARIHQNYQNANAQISNQNSQFNTEIAYREAEAQAKDRAMRQNVDSQAIHSMASNFGKMSKSSKQDNMEQKELDMFMYRYKNEPGFKEQVDKFRTA